MDVAPAMSMKVPPMVMDLDHRHVAPVTPPSGSDRLAVNAASTTNGAIDDRVTVPVSSTLMTVTVTSMVSEALSSSVALTVTL